MSENDSITWTAKFASPEEMKAIGNRTEEEEKESVRKIDLLERYFELLIKHYPGSTEIGSHSDLLHCLENMDNAINLLRTAGFSRDEAEIQFIESVNDYRRSTYVQPLGPEV